MLTLFILAFIAVVAVLIGSIGRRLKQDSKAVQHDQGRLMDFFSEAITGFRLFKAYGVEENEKQRFDDLNDSWKKGYQSMLFRKYLASPLTEFLAIIVVASILIIGSLFVFNDGHSPQSLSFLSQPLVISSDRQRVFLLHSLVIKRKCCRRTHPTLFI